MDTRPQPTLAELLVAEDDAAVADARCPSTGLPLWPQVRSVFFRMAMSDLLYGVAIGSADAPADRPSGRAARVLARSLLHNAGLHWTGRSRADVCLVSSGVGNQRVDERWMNRLSDHFALAIPDRSITLEEHFGWAWHFPRHNERTLMHAPLQAANALSAHAAVRERHRRQAAALMALVSERASKHLGWRPGAQREQALVQMLARKAAGLPSQVGRYEKLLRRVRPRVLIALGATYGPAAAMIATARRLGIETAEFQHGVIAPGHDAYNFAPSLRASEAYLEVLPAHFLSYGAWWSTQINAPLRMWTVGNPQREYRIAHTPPVRGPKDRILILSDGVEFELYAVLALQLREVAARRGLKVVLRPHPTERASVRARGGRGLEGIEIDLGDDLYLSLVSAHAVVSELSTGLFEAAGLADKLFIWDTAKARFCFPAYPFQPFTDAQALASLLDDGRSGACDAGLASTIWAEGWRARYDAFLSHCGVA